MGGEIGKALLESGDRQRRLGRTATGRMAREPGEQRPPRGPGEHPPSLGRRDGSGPEATSTEREARRRRDRLGRRGDGGEQGGSGAR